MAAHPQFSDKLSQQSCVLANENRLRATSSTDNCSPANKTILARCTMREAPAAIADDLLEAQDIVGEKEIDGLGNDLRLARTRELMGPMVT